MTSTIPTATATATADEPREGTARLAEQIAADSEAARDAAVEALAEIQRRIDEADGPTPGRVEREDAKFKVETTTASAGNRRLEAERARRAVPPVPDLARVLVSTLSAALSVPGQTPACQGELRPAAHSKSTPAGRDSGC